MPKSSKHTSVIGSDDFFKCPRCKVPLVLKKSKFKKDRTGVYYFCPNEPKCDIRAARHPNGGILSYPADAITRRYRIRVHEEAERIWGQWGDPFTDKVAMYRWLKENTSKGHIGKMRLAELRIVLKMLKNMKSRRYS